MQTRVRCPGTKCSIWLEAEAELIAERNLTRIHGFHNRSKNTFPKQPTMKESIYENIHHQTRGSAHNV